MKCFELDVTNLPKHQNADQAMIQDLLTIRADRDNYYYGYQAILGLAKLFPVLLLSILADSSACLVVVFLCTRCV